MGWRADSSVVTADSTGYTADGYEPPIGASLYELMGTIRLYAALTAGIDIDTLLDGSITAYPALSGEAKSL